MLFVNVNGDRQPFLLLSPVFAITRENLMRLLNQVFNPQNKSVCLLYGCFSKVGLQFYMTI